MRPSFSENMGLKQQKAVQVRSMDEDLLVALWNALDRYFRLLDDNWKAQQDSFPPALRLVLWTKFFKRTRDSMPVHQIHYSDLSLFLDFVRSWVFDSSREWHEIYDLL